MYNNNRISEKCSLTQQTNTGLALVWEVDEYKTANYRGFLSITRHKQSNMLSMSAINHPKQITTKNLVVRYKDRQYKTFIDIKQVTLTRSLLWKRSKDKLIQARLRIVAQNWCWQWFSSFSAATKVGHPHIVTPEKTSTTTWLVNYKCSEQMIQCQSKQF